MEKTTQVARPASAALDKLHALVDKTRTSNPTNSDIRAIRSHLRKHPELWRIYGDVAEFAFDKIVDTVAGQPAIAESLTAGREAMRREHGYDRASALERGLIDHVIVCWLRLWAVEYSQSSAIAKDLSRREMDYWDKRLSAAQHRFLRACQTLARIRKLGVPNLQVNIGAKQLNVANQLKDLDVSRTEENQWTPTRPARAGGMSRR